MFERLLSNLRSRRRPTFSPRRAIPMVEALEMRAVPATSFTPSTLTDAVAGVKYTQALTSTNSTTYSHFSIVKGSGALPKGISISSTGTISGTARAVGTFTFTVQATPGSSTTPVMQPYTLIVDAPTLTLSPNTTTLPDAKVAVHDTQKIKVSGGNGPYTFTITSGHLPTGMTLNKHLGTFDGVPHAPGTFDFTVKVTDATTGTGAPFSTSQTYSLTVQPGNPAFVEFLTTFPLTTLTGTLPAFSLKVVDAFGNPLNDVTVTLHLATLASLGSTSFTTTSVLHATTGTNGVAQFGSIGVVGRGVFRIEADAGSVKGFSNVFEVALNGTHSPA